MVGPGRTEKMDQKLEGYRGLALEIIQKYRAKVGQKISIVTEDGFETTGLLIPRYEHADANHFVLKLKSGYNIGISAHSIKSLIVHTEDPGAKSKEIDSPSQTSR